MLIKKGFTLVELLVVIAIIGLLSTVAVMSATSSKVTARNTKRKADLVQISKALELYFSDNGAYPSTGATHPAWAVCNGSGSFTVKGDSGPGGWIPDLAPTYMGILPRDPNTNKLNPLSGLGACRTTASYSCYLYESDGIDYLLAAHCTPEGTIASSDPFYYPGPGQTYMYVIHTQGAGAW